MIHENINTKRINKIKDMLYQCGKTYYWTQQPLHNHTLYFVFYLFYFISFLQLLCTIYMCMFSMCIDIYTHGHIAECIKK